MAQLYHQRQIPPGEWLLSGPETGSQLELNAPATIVYATGGSDTLPAYTPAVLAGGIATFDRSTDVYVPYVVKGDPTLRLIKEADLPTLTSDYAPLARVELHSVKPYQPEPYLAAGSSSGPLTPGGAPVASTPATERLYNLGNSSAYLSPPSGWQDVGFDDSAWLVSVDDSSSESGGGGASIGGATWVTYTGGTGSLPGSQEFLLRRAFVLLPGPVLSAAVQIVPDADLLGAWINGTSILASAIFNSYTSVITLSIPATALNAGAANVLGLWVRNGRSDMVLAGTMAAQYSLTASGNGTGGVPTPPGTAAEGDILYYHSGQWTLLPAGTNGYELTMVSGDPAWTAQPASGGTVTSVALAGPTGTTVSGSPVTTSGTLTLSWASQTANTVLAAPNGSSGVPTFRVLAAGDIPALPASQITSGQLAAARGGTGLDGSGAANGAVLIGNGSGYSLATLTAGSNVTITNGAGTITIASTTGGSGTVTSVTLTMPGIFSVAGSPITTSGTLAVSLATQSANTVFAGPAAGAAAAPTFRALQPADLPAAAAAGGHIHAHGHFL